MAQPVSNDQTQPGGAIPVRLVTADGAAFYNASGGSSGGGAPLGYQQLSLSSTAQALTVPAGAETALIIVEGDTVRWRDDGTAPTSTVGMPIYSGQTPEPFAGDLANVNFISASTSTLNVSYYS